jgi:hypothetical protein
VRIVQVLGRDLTLTESFGFLVGYRSTILDTWQLAQLRNMKVGGNASATDFFNRHGGASLLTNSDIKAKYISQVAELYKEELAKRVKGDASMCVICTFAPNTC